MSAQEKTEGKSWWNKPTRDCKIEMPQEEDSKKKRQ